MDAHPEKPVRSVPLCVVCAQPAEKLKCVKCKTPYCSIACQTVDWKERGHKKECKRLVKANAVAAKGAAGGAARDGALTPLPSPKPKAAPPVVDGPARGPADVAAAKAAAAATTAIVVPPPEPEHWMGTPRCPICLEDWNPSAKSSIRLCCCKSVCLRCHNKYGGMSAPCPLCRTPTVKTDEEKLTLLRRHCESDNPAATRHLAGAYKWGSYGLVPSQKKAARLFQRAADLGSVMAMMSLGIAYDEGHGVKLDRKKAVKYYRMAADRDYAPAMLVLGEAYYHGQGIKLDKKKAVTYFRMATDLGFAEAQHNLGICHLEGVGVAQDYAEAMRLFKLAADQGQIDAEFRLGVTYMKGNGVARDDAEAVRWYERAAAQGHERAKAALAHLGKWFGRPL